MRKTSKELNNSEQILGCNEKIREIEVELLNTQIILDNIEGVKVELQTKFRDLRSEELNLTNEFKEKYGNGEFNIEQGTFTPIS